MAEASQKGIDTLPSGRFRARLRGRSLGTYNTEAEAVAVREAAIAELRSGKWEDAGQLTLARFGGDWLKRRARSGKRAIATDKSRWMKHVLAHAIAQMPLRAIRRRHVAVWLDELAKKGIAGSTIQRCLALVRRCFHDAVHREIRRDNPASKHEIPLPIPREPWTYLTVPEQQQIVDCDVAEPLKLLALFAIGTGLRQGEQMALRMSDVVVDGPDPHVVVCFGNRKGDPPKNGKVRRVPLFGLGLEAARLWIEWRLFMPRADKQPWFFCVGQRWFRRCHRGEPAGGFGIVLAAAGIQHRPHLSWHALRHTCASSLVAGWWGECWTLYEVKELLGHSSIRVTERYAHLAHSALRARANRTGHGNGHGPGNSSGSQSNSTGHPGLRIRGLLVRVQPGVPPESLRILPGGGRERDHDVTSLARRYLAAVARGEATHSMGVEAVEALLDELALHRAHIDGAEGNKP